MKPSLIFVGIVICGMFTMAVVALFFIDPPHDAKEPLLILIGALAAAFGAFVNFCFGSSSGAARKDELLAQSNPPTPP